MAVFYSFCSRIFVNDELVGMADELGCSMGQQKFFTTKSPKHTDTGYSTIAGRIDIHIAVTHIHAFLSSGSKLSHSFNDRIRRWFFPNVIPFADGDRDQCTEKVRRFEILSVSL